MTRPLMRELIAAVAGSILLGALQAPRVRAQSASPAKFEVASVKANKSASNRGSDLKTEPGGRLLLVNYALYGLIAEAYGVSWDSKRMSGGPDWIRSERFDIEARAEKDSIAAEAPDAVRLEKMRPMLQALLADRFKLSVRRESKEMPVYAVAIGKGGVKMAKANLEEKDCGAATPCHDLQGGQGRGLHGKAVGVDDLIGLVERWSDRPLINRTELKGLYKIDTEGFSPLLQTASGEHVHAEGDRLTLFDIFSKQLGLVLEPRKAIVETLVIERVERPSGN